MHIFHLRYPWAFNFGIPVKLLKKNGFTPTRFPQPYVVLLWMGYESFFITCKIRPFECKTRCLGSECHKELLTWWGVQHQLQLTIVSRLMIGKMPNSKFCGWILIFFEKPISVKRGLFAFSPASGVIFSADHILQN